MTTENVLVTGGSGFLGSHLCERLLSEGYGVICMDNLLTGRLENIEHMMDEKAFEFCEASVTEYIGISGAVNYVLHFASPASPKDYYENPIHTLKVGAIGTLNALGLARSKSAVFLLASTSEIYGDPLESPQRETYWGNVNPLGKRSVYDEAKRFAEAITMAYHREHGVDTRIARIFNCYGPRMRPNDGRALPNFIFQSSHGIPITVFGDGSQTRSFCHVDDLVEGLFRLLTIPESKFGEALDRVVNIGNPEELSMLEVAQLVRDSVNSCSDIEFLPLPQDDPKTRRPDITKAKKLLGWQPQITFQEGLRRTVT